jgi:hypothetical protein
MEGGVNKGGIKRGYKKGDSEKKKYGFRLEDFEKLRFL